MEYYSIEMKNTRIRNNNSVFLEDTRFSVDNISFSFRTLSFDDLNEEEKFLYETKEIFKRRLSKDDFENLTCPQKSKIQIRDERNLQTFVVYEYIFNQEKLIKEYFESSEEYITYSFLEDMLPALKDVAADSYTKILEKVFDDGFSSILSRLFYPLTIKDFSNKVIEVISAHHDELSEKDEELLLLIKARNL